MIVRTRKLWWLVALGGLVATLMLVSAQGAAAARSASAHRKPDLPRPARAHPSSAKPYPGPAGTDDYGAHRSRALRQ